MPSHDDLGQITLTLPDGSAREVGRGYHRRRAGGLDRPGPGQGRPAAKVDGDEVDLDRPIDHDATVAIVTASSDDGREVLRHSTAHVMAQAVFDLFPGAKYAIGPAIADGFYYDFELPGRRSTSPTTTSSASRRACARSWPRTSRSCARSTTSTTRRSQLFADQPYKHEIIGNVDRRRASDEDDAGEVTGDGTVGVHKNLRTDGTAVRRPVPRSARAVHRQARRVQADQGRRARTGGATRSARCCSASTAPRGRSKAALEEHLHRLEEAERRDHRKLGVELDLFSFPDEIGSGLAVFHPKGGTVRRVMEDYCRKRHVDAGYEFVNSPHITKSAPVRGRRATSTGSPTACTRRWSSTAARSTTSSR